jgi:hypothetical protein
MALTTTRVRARDRVLEDVVRESVVDQELRIRRRRWLAGIAAVVLIGLLFVLL